MEKRVLENSKRVVIYGNSLNMAGIAASLKADARLEVVCFDPHDPSARIRLEETAATAIAYDLNDPPSELDLKLMRGQPDLLLVGVDPSSDEVLILSGQLTRVLSGRQLAELISNHATNSSQSGIR